MIMVKIVERLREINKKLQKVNRIRFILVLTLVLFILGISLRIIFSLIVDKDIIWFDAPLKGENIFVVIFVMAILTPIIETYINQSLPYTLLMKIKYLNGRKYLILLISALFFGICHFYSLFYIIYAFFLGITLMYAYMIRISVDKKTYYLIAISHSLFNLGISLLNYFSF